MDVEARGLGLLQNTIPATVWKDHKKPKNFSARIFTPLLKK